MIAEKNLVAVYEKIGQSKTPLIVVVDGVHSFRLKAHKREAFDSIQQKEYIPEKSIVGAYSEIGFDEFKEDVAETVKFYQPFVRSTDNLGKKRAVVDCIMTRGGEFTCYDIARITGASSKTVLNHIHALIDEGKIKFIGTKPASHGVFLYAVSGTDAATRYYPSNEELIFQYLEKTGGASATEIADATGVFRDSVKNVLRRNHKKGLLANRAEGKYVIYYICDCDYGVQEAA